jgi:hypothetical protein
MSALVGVALGLRGVAVGDPLGQPAAVPLGARRLGHQLVPVAGVRRKNPPVAHDEGDAGRVEAVFQKLERAPEVPLPAVGVPGEEQVVTAPRGRTWAPVGEPDSGRDRDAGSKPSRHPCQ